MLIYSHNRFSEGAKALAQELQIRRVKHNSEKRLRPTLIINWGSSELPRRLQGMPVLNAPEAVANVTNKLKFFQLLKDTKLGDRDVLPWWTDTKETAAAKMAERGCKIVCRTILSGSGGAGIVIATTPEELVDAKLYVRYVPKKNEYRVHIFKQQVIDIQEKARRHDVENPNWEVRNLEGGFIYKREGINPPNQIEGLAIVAMATAGLDFGAVDIVWNENKARGYVLEINSAPGLEGTTVHSYANAIKNLR